jgi:hypothetical protein
MNPSRAIRGHPVHYGTAPWIGKGIALIERHWRLFVTVYSVIVLGIIVACGITGTLFWPDFNKRDHLVANYGMDSCHREAF